MAFLSAPAPERALKFLSTSWPSADSRCLCALEGPAPTSDWPPGRAQSDEPAPLEFRCELGFPVAEADLDPGERETPPRREAAEIRDVRPRGPRAALSAKSCPRAVSRIWNMRMRGSAI